MEKPFQVHPTGKLYKTLAGAMSGERAYAARKGGKFLHMGYGWKNNLPVRLNIHYVSVDEKFTTTIVRMDGERI